MLFSKKVSLLLAVFGTILLFPSITRAEANICEFDCLEAVALRDTHGTPCSGSGGYVYVRRTRQAPASAFTNASACTLTSGCQLTCQRQCPGGFFRFLSVSRFPEIGGQPACIIEAPNPEDMVPMYTVAQACPSGTDNASIQAVTNVGPWNSPRCIEPAPAPSTPAACTDPAPPAGARAGQCHFSCITAVDRTNPRGDRPGGGHCDNVTVGPTRNEGSCTIGQNCNCLQTCENICGRSTGGLSKCFIGVNSDTTHFNACDAHGATAPQCGAPAPAAAGTAGSPSTLTNPLGTDDLGVLISRFIRALTGVAGAFALLMFVAGGIIWMTSESSDRAKLAQTIMKNATIGLLMIFFSYAIVNIFLSVLGV